LREAFSRENFEIERLLCISNPEIRNLQFRICEDEGSLRLLRGLPSRKKRNPTDNALKPACGRGFRNKKMFACPEVGSRERLVIANTGARRFSVGRR
jgi:hypothetical protein